jgi:uncharacterized membrane protein YphA (DoxX/SURF4 family)
MLMPSARDLSLIALRLVLGAVVLERSCALVLDLLVNGAPEGNGLPHGLLLVLGWTEIAAAILFLAPPTLVAGAWALVGVFLSAIALHVAHGQYDVGGLIVWMMAVLVVLAHRRPWAREAGTACRSEGFVDER